MWEKIRVIFTIPELRNKILLTLALLGIYRIGYWISLPMVDRAAIASTASGPSVSAAGVSAWAT